MLPYIAEKNWQKERGICTLGATNNGKWYIYSISTDDPPYTIESHSLYFFGSIKSRHLVEELLHKLVREFDTGTVPSH
jgi:hypothetical protein